MAGIAGIEAAGRRDDVERMLGAIAHRGKAGKNILEFDNATLGAVWLRVQPHAFDAEERAVKDTAADDRVAVARVLNGGPLLVRGLMGIAPLYFGHAEDGTLCFASEVKGLLCVTTDVRLLPAGGTCHGESVTKHFELTPHPVTEDPEAVAEALRQTLGDAVRRCVQDTTMGSWLSGGLDSSAIVALARPVVGELHTFAAGLRGAPDLEYARAVADHVGTTHHERTVTVPEMLRVLPNVIYHLESFDALLVRSSITNYLVAQLASDHVEAVFSGEGGDELFAGYAYLKAIPAARLAGELTDITRRLHNTALQRVDRCAAAHGIMAYVPFLALDVVDYALSIPVSLKIRDGIEKWILRQAVADLLPPRVATRPKAKFWEGAGVAGLMAEHADNAISDSDFRRERVLPNGWSLNSKEELMYYRIFKEHFGRCKDLDWMGRTKGAPIVGV